MPQIGDVVNTPEVNFPMTVETTSQETYTCGLVGFDPATNELVRLPRVCPEFLWTATPAAE
jgi:hypothetical protein